jgi:aromatic ring-opening dioxygenase LigB subunit
MQTTNGINLLSCSGTTSILNTWSNPERVEVNEVGETIEMIYKQTSMLTYTVYPSPPTEVRVFKIVYSCVDGKWNKSEPIFGKIIPLQDEYFEFED